MGPAPAASRRFMAYSGEVCRYSGTGAARPGSRHSVRRFSRCGSVTPAAASSGVSTSITRRSEKKARTRSSVPARSLSVSSDAPGRQSDEAVGAKGIAAGLFLDPRRIQPGAGVDADDFIVVDEKRHLDRKSDV